MIRVKMMVQLSLASHHDKRGFALKIIEGMSCYFVS